MGLKVPKKYLLGSNGQFGPILGQDYAVHYLRISSKDFFKLCTITGYNETAKIKCLCFPKKFLLWDKLANLGPFGAKLCISLSTVRIFFKLCTLTGYDDGKKLACLQFPKKTSLGTNDNSGPFWGQNIVLLYPSNWDFF